MSEKGQQRGRMSEADSSRGEGVASHELVRKAGWGEIFQHEDEHIGNDDEPVHDGETAGALGIFDRDHRSLFLEKV